MRPFFLFFFFAGLLGCDRIFHRETPDAAGTVVSVSDAATTAPTASAEEEEDEATSAADAGPCPRTIHPDYCRRRCTSYQERLVTMHARRIGRAARAGLGTCGAFKVFAEDELGDAGPNGGIVEFFNDAGALVGALDTRHKSCGQFGEIPPCAPAINWEGGRSLTIRAETATVTGKLPVEVIQRIVRQSYGRFRLCYANRKDKAPLAPGRVVIKFVINRDGGVTSLDDSASDLASNEVKSCIKGAFNSLSFPQPEGGGTVSVTYPMYLSP